MTINTATALHAAIDACVTRDAMVRTMSDATRAAIATVATSVGMDNVNRRTPRDAMVNYVVDAAMADRDRATAAAIMDAVSNGTPADNDTPDDPAPTVTPGRDRSAARGTPHRDPVTFAVDDTDGTYTCVGACGMTYPVTAFFPTVKAVGGHVATRTRECTKCMDLRRAWSNPTSGLGGRVIAAHRRAVARGDAGAIARNAPVNVVPGVDTV